MRNSRNIRQHELIGLDCEVIGSSNKSQIGSHGKIIDETMKMIMLRTPNGRKRIQKKGSIFRLDLGDNRVDVDGSSIVSRPEDRIKKKTKRW